MTDRTERFGWLERPGDDFPFYNGEPATISGGPWWLVMAAILAGFLVLTLSNPLLTGAFLGFVPIVAFFALPLAALRDHLRLGTGFGDDSLQDGVLEQALRGAIAAIEGRTEKALIAPMGAPSNSFSSLTAYRNR